jgi:hypothetical protein
VAIAHVRFGLGTILCAVTYLTVTRVDQRRAQPEMA